MKLTIFYQGTLLLVFLTACSGLFPAPTLTPTPISATETPTPTILWFPPTNTPAIFPTRTILSTPEQRPGLGELLFTDSFDQPDLWDTSVASWASATVTRNRLILSISGPGPVPIASLRSQPKLGDFYAEATVILNLCGGKDQFGMIFRAASSGNYYRFAVRCDGQARPERVLSGSNSPLLDWQSSGDAPIAAPAEVKLGVWTVGSEMRFFLNDHYQFTVRDPLLPAGTLGFFAYASGATPITASFSDLSVYSVAYVSPTPSLTPSSTPIPSRTPIP
ncbi:MAG: hypothetical protein Q8N46_03280 [Anaerolineales bacterium]|nr:hypothetical protein [Anaerolineales bacterium]